MQTNILKIMSSAEDFQVQNVYRYSRKSYKKNKRNCQDEGGSPCEEAVEEASPRSRSGSPGPGCSCERDTEGDIANILHKKCPVISLAQQQLHRLLDGTDRLLCDNSRCCKTISDFVRLCREATNENKMQCALMVMVSVAFCVGVLIGAASCGAYLGRFNSPILNCLDNFFVRDSFASVQHSFCSIA